MKKLLFVLFAGSLALGASAQTVPTKKEASKNARTDVKNLKEERKERNTAIAHGKMKTAKKEQKEIKTIRKDLNANKKILKNKGVARPVDKAKDQVNGKG